MPFELSIEHLQWASTTYAVPFVVNLGAAGLAVGLALQGSLGTILLMPDNIEVILPNGQITAGISTSSPQRDVHRHQAA